MKPGSFATTCECSQGQLTRFAVSLARSKIEKLGRAFEMALALE
jgi:hypothetical protein